MSDPVLAIITASLLSLFVGFVAGALSVLAFIGAAAAKARPSHITPKVGAAIHAAVESREKEATPCGW